jgi:NADPH2 dehydrogenase
MTYIFNPFTQRSLTLKNRIVMSPMCTYVSEKEGKVTDFHFVHYGARALGGAGLIILESTAVEARGRISMKDLGIWEDSQIEGLQRIAGFVKKWGSKAGIQLAHAGRKAKVDEPVIAPSAIPYNEKSPIPIELSRDEIQSVIQSFIDGAHRTKLAGFDLIEIHGAHGYLINQFISPLSNKRTDEYGGSLENRCRLLCEVVKGIRTVWPEENPLYLRISAIDHVEGGITIDDSIEIAKLVQPLGVDLIDVSSGAVLPVRPPRIYPGYQVQYAEDIKRKAGVATGCVGLITSTNQADEILGSERADLIFIGREFLRNPCWVMEAAYKFNIEYDYPTPSYSRAYLTGYKPL